MPAKATRAKRAAPAGAADAPGAMPPAGGAPRAPAPLDARFFNRLLVHDVTNLASGLQMQVELTLREPGLPEKVRHRLEGMQALTGRMVALVRNVQVLNDPGPEPVLQTMDLRWALDQTVQAVRSMFPRARLRIHDQLGREPLLVLADPSLEQALFNVLMNAVYHNPREEPMLWLRPGEPGAERRVVVRVEDNGPGLPAEVRQAIGALQPTEGKRVGLQAAALLLARLGGRLEVEDRVAGDPGKGTACQLELRAPGGATPTS